MRKIQKYTLWQWLFTLLLVINTASVLDVSAQSASSIPENVKNMKFDTKAGLPGSITEGTQPDFAGKVIAIMLQLVATVAIVVMIYGGVRMMMAQGSDTGIKKGQGAFLQAIIGTLIVLVAYILVSFIQTLVTTA